MIWPWVALIAIWCLIFGKVFIEADFEPGLVGVAIVLGGCLLYCAFVASYWFLLSNGAWGIAPQ